MDALGHVHTCCTPTGAHTLLWKCIGTNHFPSVAIHLFNAPHLQQRKNSRRWQSVWPGAFQPYLSRGICLNTLLKFTHGGWPDQQQASTISRRADSLHGAFWVLVKRREEMDYSLPTPQRDSHLQPCCLQYNWCWLSLISITLPLTLPHHLRPQTRKDRHQQVWFLAEISGHFSDIFPNKL